jgi:hypothetical protein
MKFGDNKLRVSWSQNGKYVLTAVMVSFPLNTMYEIPDLLYVHDSIWKGGRWALPDGCLERAKI